MNWEGWVFTVALLFCVFAIITYEPREQKKCDILHPVGAPIADRCENY